MAYEVIPNRPDVHRILLEERAEGVYVNVFETSTSPGPYKDWLQDDLEMAKRACRQDYGIQETEWREVPDEPWHSPSADG
jgi:hypothetical protein